MVLRLPQDWQLDKKFLTNLVCDLFSLNEKTGKKRVNLCLGGERVEEWEKARMGECARVGMPAAEVSKVVQTR